MSLASPIPPRVLRDIFVERLQAAHRRFGTGLLLNEEPLLSHVCAEAIGTIRRNVGGLPLQINSNGDIMHRRGIGQTDMFGFDLAWSLRVVGQNVVWLKTAFFQLKLITRTRVGRSPRVDIEMRQITDARQPGYWERGFAVAVDPDSPLAFLAALSDLRDVTNRSGRMTVNCSIDPWRNFETWLLDWLSCKVGIQGSPQKEGIAPVDPEKEVPSPRIRMQLQTSIDIGL